MMKNLPHLRFWLFYFLIGIMTLISIFTYWLVYPFRVIIRRHKWTWIGWFLWLFLNDDEKNKNGYNDFGAEWWLKEINVNVNEDSFYLKRLYYAYRWSVFRNGVYNLQLSNKPKYGVKENIIEVINEPKEYHIFTWRNKQIKGKQFVKWTVKGVKYFRYSFTNNWINIMYGYSEIRLILKVRLLK